MPNAPVSFTVLCSNNSYIKKWKTIVNLTKFGTEKHTSLQMALNLYYKRKSDKTHLLKRIFLHREKDQTKNFSPFLYKRPFDHRKEFLKNSQFHFKGFHFKSTSRSSFNKVWWKSRNYTEIRNLLEAYLEPSQRSLTEPFCVMAFNR